MLHHERMLKFVSKNSEEDREKGSARLSACHRKPATKMGDELVFSSEADFQPCQVSLNSGDSDSGIMIRRPAHFQQFTLTLTLGNEAMVVPLILEPFNIRTASLPSTP